jgi:hypothetical protein
MIGSDGGEQKRCEKERKRRNKEEEERRGRGTVRRGLDCLNTV